ncbi:MAG: hypothetical protein ACK56I_23525, partial [bacterium]
VWQATKLRIKLQIKLLPGQPKKQPGGDPHLKALPSHDHQVWRKRRLSEHALLQCSSYTC